MAKWGGHGGGLHAACSAVSMEGRLWQRGMPTTRGCCPGAHSGLEAHRSASFRSQAVCACQAQTAACLQSLRQVLQPQLARPTTALLFMGSRAGIGRPARGGGGGRGGRLGGRAARRP